MLELQNDQLVFSFSDVHPSAKLGIDFQRTLRIPDDNTEYPLPPGAGRFPLRHVDDYAPRLPEKWRERGGVLLPIYQSEALWIYLEPTYDELHQMYYPFAIKVATGKINALTGDTWDDSLSRSPQNYLVSPRQPWLDGYSVGESLVRQFVATPLGEGRTTEEQLTERGVYGGIQLIVYPMKRSAFESRFPAIDPSLYYHNPEVLSSPRDAFGGDMGMAPGGRMHQQIYKDHFNLEDWDLDRSNRCFVHMANSLVWRAVTGENPPITPMTAFEYEQEGYPWFEFYGKDAEVISGSKTLDSIESLAEQTRDGTAQPLPENVSVQPKRIVDLTDNSRLNSVRKSTRDT